MRSRSTFWFLFLEKDNVIPIVWWHVPSPVAEGLGPRTFREAEQRFLLLFLEKEENQPTIASSEDLGFKTFALCFFSGKQKNMIHKTIDQLVGGKPPNPRGSASRKVWGSGHSAKRNNAFCFFFWKKKKTSRQQLHLRIAIVYYAVRDIQGLGVPDLSDSFGDTDVVCFVVVETVEGKGRAAPESALSDPVPDAVHSGWDIVDDTRLEADV
jgi:hypothetical protein